MSLKKSQTPAMKKNENPLNEISDGQGVFRKAAELVENIGQAVGVNVRRRGTAFRVHDANGGFPG